MRNDTVLLNNDPVFRFNFLIKVNKKVPRPFIIRILSVAFTVLSRETQKITGNQAGTIKWCQPEVLKIRFFIGHLSSETFFFGLTILLYFARPSGT